MRAALTFTALAVAIALAACTRTLDPPTPEEWAPETHAAIVSGANTLLLGNCLGYRTAYRETLDERDRQRLDAARERGGTLLPVFPGSSAAPGEAAAATVRSRAPVPPQPAYEAWRRPEPAPVSGREGRGEEGRRPEGQRDQRGGDGDGLVFDSDADLEWAVMGVAGRAEGIGRLVGQGVGAHRRSFEVGGVRGGPAGGGRGTAHVRPVPWDRGRQDVRGGVRLT